MTINFTMKSALAIAALAGSTLAASAQDCAEMKAINVLAPATRSMVFYPVMAAEALGYFADECLTVNYLPADTTIPYVAFLQNGQADVVMLDGPQTFQAVQAGLPIAIVFEANQRAPEGIHVAAGSDIQSVKDLEGKTVGLVSDRDVATLKWAMNVGGADFNSVTTVIVGDAGPTLANAFKRETVAAVVGALPDFIAINANGIPTRDIYPTEIAETPANSFAVNTETIDEKSVMLEGFFRAWAKGQAVGKIDRPALEKMSAMAAPEEWLDENFAKAFMDGAIPLNSPISAGYGAVRHNSWEAVQGGMMLIGEIAQPYDVDTFLDGRFINGSNTWTYQDVVDDVAAWHAANM